MSKEEVVWRGKPTVLAFYDVLVGGFMLIAVSAAVAWLLPWLSLVGAACGAVLVLVAFAKAQANTYTVTGKVVRREYRFVAVRIDEAPLEKVTDTVVVQGLVGRVLGFGDIRFDTAGTTFAGVEFKGVKNPVQAKMRIDEMLKSVTRS